MTVSVSDMEDAEELGRPVPPLDLPVDQQVLRCSVPCSTG